MNYDTFGVIIKQLKTMYWNTYVVKHQVIIIHRDTAFSTRRTFFATPQCRIVCIAVPQKPVIFLPGFSLGKDRLFKGSWPNHVVFAFDRPCVRGVPVWEIRNINHASKARILHSLIEPLIMFCPIATDGARSFTLTTVNQIRTVRKMRFPVGRLLASDI